MSAVHAATLVAWRSSARAGHGGIAMASLAARVRTLLGAIDPRREELLWTLGATTVRPGALDRRPQRWWRGGQQAAPLPRPMHDI